MSLRLKVGKSHLLGSSTTDIGHHQVALVHLNPKLQYVNLIRENRNLEIWIWCNICRSVSRQQVERICNLPDKGAPLLAIPVQKKNNENLEYCGKKNNQNRNTITNTRGKRTTRIIQTQLRPFQGVVLQNHFYDIAHRTQKTKMKPSPCFFSFAHLRYWSSL